LEWDPVAGHKILIGLDSMSNNALIILMNTLKSGESKWAICKISLYLDTALVDIW
jgi:hypothetical protein